MTKSIHRGIYSLLFFLVGFNALTAQIIYIREFLVVFSGNEISLGLILASWLLWTALGSFISVRIPFNRCRLSWQILSLTLLIPVTVFGIRLSKLFITPIPGEIAGIIEILIATFIILAPVSFVLGSLFVACSRFFKSEFNVATSYATARVYLWESVGAAVGGLLLSLFLFRLLDALSITLLLSLLNFLLFIYFYAQISSRTGMIFIGVGYLLFLLSLNGLNPVINRVIWRPLQFIAEEDSPFGKLSLVESENNRILYENGTVLYSSGQEEIAEENVHYALLMHPNPETVLMIGGGLSGGLTETVKHPSLERLDYVELDPAVISFFRKNFPNQWKQIVNESKIRIVMADGRAFLKQSKEQYDVIIVNMPDPSTMQLNRFYTKEFYNEVTDRLKSGGILSFRVSGSENYINTALAKYLSSLYHTLKVEFNHVGIMPGARVHFFASPDNKAVIPSPDTLIQRIKRRGIQTQYVQEYFIIYRLMPDRTESLMQEIQSIETVEINSDFKPASYYFALVLWGMQFIPGISAFMIFFSNGIYWHLFLFILISGFIIILFSIRRFPSEKYRKGVACFAVMGMGFSVMTLEIALLLVFQSLFGYLYNQVAILMAAVMSGLALGSWFSLKIGMKNSFYKMLFSHSGLVIISLLFFILVTHSDSDIYRIQFFPIMMLLIGFLGGYQFPLVNELYGKTEGNPGIIYGFDLLGALVAALLVSIIFIPLFGLYKTTLFIILINFLIIIALITYHYQAENVQQPE